MSRQAQRLDEIQKSLTEWLEAEGPAVVFSKASWPPMGSGGSGSDASSPQSATPLSATEDPWLKDVEFNKDAMNVTFSVDLDYEGFKTVSILIPESYPRGTYNVYYAGEELPSISSKVAPDMKEAMRRVWMVLSKKRDKLLLGDSGEDDEDEFLEDMMSPTEGEGEDGLMIVELDGGEEGEVDPEDDMFAGNEKVNRAKMTKLMEEFNTGRFCSKKGWFGRFGLQGADKLRCHLFFPPRQTLGLSKMIARAWGIDLSKYMVVQLSFNNALLLLGMMKPDIEIFQAFSVGDTVPTPSGKCCLQMPDQSGFGFAWTVEKRIEGNFFRKVDVDDDGMCLVGEGKLRSKKSFLIGAVEEAVRIINSASYNCLICGDRMRYVAIKPSVCEKQLCIFAHEEFGLGLSLENEIENNGDVCDLIFLMSSASSAGTMTPINRFNPFPIGVKGKPMVEDGFGLLVEGKEVSFVDDAGSPVNSKVRDVYTKVPGIQKMQSWVRKGILKKKLDAIDPRMYGLLRWTITSNRTHLHKLSPKKRLAKMQTDHQFLLMSGTAKKERIFQELKARHGSFQAWHGSGLQNWHCILRVGLKNYSGTKGMTSGQAYGPGVYFAGDCGTSFGYMRFGSAPWRESFIKDASLGMLALCEIIKQPGVKGYEIGPGKQPYYVIPNEDHIQTRLFFVYTSQQSRSVNIQANALKIPKVSWWD